MEKRSWSELSDRQKTALLTLASVEVALTVTALIDLVRRPAEQIHGRKAFWAPALFVQPIGPIAYLVVHRR